MDVEICKKFQDVREYLSDCLHTSGSYKFNDAEFLNNHCYGKQCYSDYDRLNAGFIYFFNEFFGNLNSFNVNPKKKPDIVDYIIIWLSYMLNLKKSEGQDIIKDFYNNYINDSDKYNKEINGVSDYEIYKDIVNKKKDLMNMDKSIISELYDAFKKLCTMHLEYDEESRDCNKHSGKAKEFVEKYKQLKENSSITKDSPHYKLLITLSNDYDNFKKKCSDVSCKDIPPLQSIEKTEITEDFSGHTSKQAFGLTVKSSEVASSSSSITNNLFIVLSIFAAIPIFLGIAYKYSLFGFRKRTPKHHLRENIKK
ncbi:hypothetical protein YYC_02830 [Plasmodium yoelii 17X]|uniref:Yir2 protein n=2 Tax=Plasmodium yoelii TaxID=5861 RepID=Q7RLH9_PLAYO|nr:putative yir2 protein [Plasmodium yoelii yoelii]ETB59311.1 hypothetical protein YYC_02830 [Plasmodium yoelii 17X]